MTSQNNPAKSSQGSALIVTILLVSVLLGAALILLQRIIPYAKSVRSMHDASQAYYTARGEVDLARLVFFYGGDTPSIAMQIPTLFGLLSAPSTPTTVNPSTRRGNIFTTLTSTKQLTRKGENEGERESELQPPFSIGSAKTTGRDHVVVSADLELPLKIKLFPQDLSLKNFGTSKTNINSHTLYSRNAGGLRFDLRGVDTTKSDFTLKLKFPPTPLDGKITMKMQYFDENSTIDPNVKTFINEYTITSTSQEIDLTSPTASLGNVQSIDTYGKITSESMRYQSFLDTTDCSSADICSISFILNSPSSDNSSIDFQLVSSAPIPDLNAVVIGDGLSNNKLYYQRIIDLIPTPQDI